MEINYIYTKEIADILDQIRKDIVSETMPNGEKYAIIDTGCVINEPCNDSVTSALESSGFLTITTGYYDGIEDTSKITDFVVHCHIYGFFYKMQAKQLSEFRNIGDYGSTIYDVLYSFLEYYGELIGDDNG